MFFCDKPFSGRVDFSLVHTQHAYVFAAALWAFDRAVLADELAQSQGGGVEGGVEHVIAVAAREVRRLFAGDGGNHINLFLPLWAMPARCLRFRRRL